MSSTRIVVVSSLLVVLVSIAGMSRVKAGASVAVEEVENCALAERLTELNDAGYDIIAVTPLTSFDIYGRKFCLGCTTVPTCFISNGSHVYTYNVIYR